jgi:hypothetical protein
MDMSLLKKLLKKWFNFKKQEKEEELQPQPSTPTNKPYHPFPELSGEEKINAVEQRLIQKFREGLIEGADLRLGDVLDDLKWLYNVMNYNKKDSFHIPDVSKWRMATYYILKKDPELWKKVEQDAEARIEKSKFEYQDEYIQVTRKRDALEIYKSPYLPIFPDFSRFTILTLDSNGKTKTKFVLEDYEAYEELELRLLQEGYKFIREDNGYLIYWKG